MSNKNEDDKPYFDPEWLKEFVKENKDTGSKIAEIYMEGYEDGKREAQEELMKEIKNENEKRKIPTVTFEDFLRHECGECKIKGPFIVREEDSEKLLEYLKSK